MATHNLRMGGVMRCCIDTLEKHCAKPDIPEAREGDVLPCLYGPCSLVYRNGAWEWPGRYEAGMDYGTVEVPRG